MRSKLKKEAIKLRKKGKTFLEIKKALGVNIPQSTLSYWLKNIPLSVKQKQRIDRVVLNNIKKGQLIALKINRLKRQIYLNSVEKRVNYLKELIHNRDVAKIALAMLYLGEGSKTQRGSLMFGNSDPQVIYLFLHLLRKCYDVDESKFRCTLQARADQNIKELERFWSVTTKISLKQFYKARIDPRTIGKISKKQDYKGVCRIDYFSADIFLELKAIIKLFQFKGL